MGIENAVCPHCGNELIVTVPTGHRLVKIVQDANMSGWVDEKWVTQMSRCPHCHKDFGAVTKDEA